MISTDSVPIWQKYLLSPAETAELSGLPIEFVRSAGNMARTGQYDFPCIWIGNRLKINRLLFEKWLQDKTDGRHDFKTEFIQQNIESYGPKKGRPRKIR